MEPTVIHDKEQYMQEELLEPGRAPRFFAEETLSSHGEGYAEHGKQQEKDIECDKREGAGGKTDDKCRQRIDGAEHPACHEV